MYLIYMPFLSLCPYILISFLISIFLSLNLITESPAPRLHLFPREKAGGWMTEWGRAQPLFYKPSDSYIKKVGKTHGQAPTPSQLSDTHNRNSYSAIR